MLLKDGHATFFTFAEAPDIAFEEKEVTPPGVAGGGANDTTTMHNEVWRTKQAKKLKELTEGSAVVAYDPAIYDDVDEILQVNQLITITFPDDSTVAFWGWLDEFKPQACKEGEQPTAEIKVLPSNENEAGEEVGPVFTPAP